MSRTMRRPPNICFIHEPEHKQHFASPRFVRSTICRRLTLQTVYTVYKMPSRRATVETYTSFESSTPMGLHSTSARKHKSVIPGTNVFRIPLRSPKTSKKSPSKNMHPCTPCQEARRKASYAHRISSPNSLSLNKTHLQLQRCSATFLKERIRAQDARSVIVRPSAVALPLERRTAVLANRLTPNILSRQ